MSKIVLSAEGYLRSLCADPRAGGTGKQQRGCSGPFPDHVCSDDTTTQMCFHQSPAAGTCQNLCGQVCSWHLKSSLGWQTLSPGRWFLDIDFFFSASAGPGHPLQSSYIPASTCSWKLGSSRTLVMNSSGLQVIRASLCHSLWDWSWSLRRHSLWTMATMKAAPCSLQWRLQSGRNMLGG